MKRARIGIIGLGQRGMMMLRSIWLNFDDVIISGLCDVYQDRIDKALESVKARRPDDKEPFTSTDYKDVLKSGEVDAVYVASSWETHLEVAVEAMKAGIAVLCEVGRAYSEEECRLLVRTYEETKTPFMFAENCCYGKEELLATAMARAGKFGTVVHCSGAYAHDLRDEVAKGNIIRHYRLRNYMASNCDNYPTHDLGPIARLLGINRGNRMVSLVSVASSAHGLAEYIKEKGLAESDPTLKDATFAQGDIVTTIIKCENGESIVLTLDTTLPRSYDRAFTVRGTKGMYSMSTNTVFFDGMKEEWEPVKFIRDNIDNAVAYEEEFLPDIWKNLTEEDKKRGHGGMDGIMVSRFIKCLINNEPMEIDVYDGAAWMSVSYLSERSIKEGGTVQYFPDFTNGAWNQRELTDVVPLGK